MKLIETILSKMTGISKPQSKFLFKALTAFLSVNGKLTFSNMSRYIGISERTFTRQFSKVFDFAKFNHITIEYFFGNKESKLAAAFDPFFMEKSGNSTQGKDFFWSGSSGRVEKGLEASLLCIVDLVKRAGFALAAKQTPNATELKQMNHVSRIDWFLNFIASVREELPAAVKYLLVDAYFFKEKFVSGIRKLGLHVIGKMRVDARLLSLYSGPQKKRGRRKKFDGPVDFDLLPDIATDDLTITLRAAEVYSTAMQTNILAVMVRKVRADGKVMVAFLFSTDTAMSPLDVYSYYSIRFQIEFVIRDAKQHAGLTHCQSLKNERINFHINMSFAAINIARIEDYERTYSSTENFICSVATQRTRYHNEMLISSIFPIFGLDPLVFKSHPAYQQALSFGAVHP